MNLIELTVPCYAPVWVRVFVVCVLAGWGIVELIVGHTMWAVMCFSFAAICTWRFATIDYRKDAD